MDYRRPLLKTKSRKSRRGYNIGYTISILLRRIKQMFTVYMKGNSLIFQSGFETWGQAELYGWNMFGLGNFEIIRE